MITFIRLRPSDQITDAIVESRVRECTTTLEVDSIGDEGIERAGAAGLLTLGSDPDSRTAAWLLTPEAALALRDVPGWRVTVDHSDTEDRTLDAVVRTGAAFLRTTRSGVAAAASRMDRPGLDVAISVFVDNVSQALAAVAAGAGDLVLRDWDSERLGELRDALGGTLLVERTVFPVGVDLDEVRGQLDPATFTAWLGQVDGSGAARPRYTWAPGMNEHPPVPSKRLSAEWGDQAWVGGTGPEQLEGAGSLRPVLERSLAGVRPGRDELEGLFRARGDQIEAIVWTADMLRRRTNGDDVSYVVNRNINYTNMCYFRCGFCAFSKGPRSLNLRGDPYLMGIDEVVDRAEEAWQRGATEVTLQGGIHPEFTGDFYVGVVEGIKKRLPDMHIHGFTPLEVWQGAETLSVPVRDFLARLADAGLGTLPGTAAEILDDRVREHLCPDKIRTAQWADVMITAHELGLRATATVMFGHIDGPASWANHYDVVRRIQERTGGFTEFVPLPFVHMGSPIFLRGRSRPGPTWDEVVLIHSVARLAFDGLIDNIQASWVKLGLDGGARLLDAGCNDLGGTLMGEIITRSAGASHGQEVSPADFERVIQGVGRTAYERTTLYERAEPRRAKRTIPLITE
ncbi:MAG: 5-amino-6-(D-ribitylamino)uracil--L-tyrosine 4-hydroxyphenyl transferase CofH [Acidimicrobiia bacterium]|nr:5-amino-6-(D-ribitylamino)uracil--L-tyrosine 4-hydroxyphenyl transferase CofH [Acidimicrobiia bacterium]